MTQNGLHYTLDFLKIVSYRKRKHLSAFIFVLWSHSYTPPLAHPASLQGYMKQTSWRDLDQGPCSSPLQFWKILCPVTNQMHKSEKTKLFNGFWNCCPLKMLTYWCDRIDSYTRGCPLDSQTLCQVINSSSCSSCMTVGENTIACLF